MPGLGTCHGAFLDGKLCGPATVDFSNGSTLRCTFRNGMPHGAGCFTAERGITYAGEFHNGHIGSQGTLCVPVSEVPGALVCRTPQSGGNAGDDIAELADLRNALTELHVQFPWKHQEGEPLEEILACFARAVGGATAVDWIKCLRQPQVRRLLDENCYVVVMPSERDAGVNVSNAA
jgi:hypothetical protein